MDQIKSIENQCAILNDEKRRVEEDARIRSDSDLQTLGKIRNEYDDLRHLKHERDQEVLALQDQIARMRQLNEQKGLEVNRLTTEVHRRTDENLGLRGTVTDLDSRIQDTRNKARIIVADLDKVNASLDDTLRSNQETVDRLRLCERDLDLSKAQEQDLSNQISAKSTEIACKGKDLAAGDAELSNLRDSINRAQSDLDHLQRRFDSQLVENDNLNRARDAEQDKAAQLNASCREVEIDIKNRESQLNATRLEGDRLRQSFNVARSNRDALEAELKTLNSHIEVVSRENNQMNGEIDGILRRDEAIKAELNDRAM